MQPFMDMVTALRVIRAETEVPSTRTTSAGQVDGWVNIKATSAQVPGTNIRLEFMPDQRGERAERKADPVKSSCANPSSARASPASPPL
jgi:hypothetical protein